MEIPGEDVYMCKEIEKQHFESHRWIYWAQNLETRDHESVNS